MHDTPAADTSLARRHRDFAKLLRQIAEESRAEDAARPLFIHLDGAPGSGKTAILAALAAELANGSGGSPSRWIVASVTAKSGVRVPGAEIAASAIRAMRDGQRTLSAAAIGLRVREMVCRLPTLLEGRHLAVVGLILLALLLLPGRIEVVTVGLLLAVASVVLLLYITVGIPQDPLVLPTLQLRKAASASHAPLAVLVDGLDELAAAEVESFLEDLATVLAYSATTIFVAADRRWLVTSAEENHAIFREAMNLPGYPLGYQLLARRFDLSLTIPSRWTESAAQSARLDLTGEPAVAIGKVVCSNPRLRVRHGLAVRVLERLYPLAGFTPDRASIYTWAMLALRWPLLADFLARNPSRVSHFRYAQQPGEAPETLARLFIDPEVTALMRDAQNHLQLDESSLRALIAPFVDARKRVAVA